MIRSGLALSVCAVFLFPQAAPAGPLTDGSPWSPVSIRSAKGAPSLELRRAAAATRGLDQLPQAPASHPPLPPRKGASGTQTETAPPEVWKPDEIAAAKKECAALLDGIGAVVEPLPPIREGRCGAAAPVRLISLGKKQKVTISPPALVNCRMVGALNTWIERDLQPLARKHLGQRIVEVSVISDYSCRRSTGRHNRWSEHAFADALDIRGFETEVGQKVSILKGWGLTERDIAAQAAAAKAQAQAKAQSSGADEREATKAALKLAAAKLGGPEERKTSDTGPKVAGLAAFPAFLPSQGPTDARNSQFLRAAHASACRIFATTLGPEANNAHRNHFHLDMAIRKYKNICD